MTEPVPSDGIVVRNARLAVKNELKKKRLLNQPIARFDPKSGKVYMEHARWSRSIRQKFEIGRRGSADHTYWELWAQCSQM